MKIFEIDYTARPKVGRFKSYASLSIQEKDTTTLNHVGACAPFNGVWNTVQLYIENPASPRPDIFGFPRAFICNERARKLLSEPLEMCAELLPITLEGEVGGFCICNILNCFNAVDKKKSTYRSLAGKKAIPMLITPTFIPERLGEGSLFKIPDDGFTRCYCLERTGDPLDGEFKAIIEKHGLTGLGFDLVWSDE